MVKLINIYGAPGAGKSTSASGLFFELKKKG
jgi:adenylate kinase family enzyme